MVESPTRYRSIQTPARENALDLVLSGGSRLIANNLYRSRDNRDVRPLTQPCKWAALDYTTVEITDLESDESLRVTGNGTALGIFLWFDSALTDDIAFSTHPTGLDSIYGDAFLPFEQPGEVTRGDRIQLSLAPTPAHGAYVWTWDTGVLAAAEPKQVKESFGRSSFYDFPISMQKLRKRASDHVPTLNDDGNWQARIPALMNGELDLHRISQNILENFPSGLPPLTRPSRQSVNCP